MLPRAEAWGVPAGVLVLGVTVRTGVPLREEAFGVPSRVRALVVGVPRREEAGVSARRCSWREVVEEREVIGVRVRL